MVEASRIRRENPEHRVREKELEQLKTWFGAPHGSVVVLHGQRGVGKNRLTEELIRHANASGHTAVLEGRTPVAGGRGFHPYAEIVHQAMNWAEQRGLTEELLDPIYDDLSAVLDHGPAEQDEAPSLDQKLRFFEAFRRLLLGMSQRERLLVVIRDLERADNDTLELASYLADELFGDPILEPESPRSGLLMLQFRDDGTTPDRARSFLNEIIERSAVRALRLDGLDLEGLKRYVHSQHVLEKLLAASAGLPQEIDALIDALPSNVEELFERKLSALGSTEQNALRALSVSSRPASARVIAEVIQQPVRSVAKALTNLRNARVIERRIHNGEFQFSFVRRRDLEVTARSVAAEDNARYHSGWATALVKEQDNGGPALLAHHQLRSSEPQRGVPLAIQASETYAVAGAFDAAVQMLEEARPHASGELLLTILNRLAQLSPMTGSPRIALRYVEEWKSALPEKDRAPALLREAELHNAAGNYSQALEALQEVRKRSSEDNALERASLETTASEAHYHLGAMDHAAECGEQGLRYLSKLQGDDPTRSRIELLNQLGKIALAHDGPNRAIELFGETLTQAQKSGLLREQARALVNLGIAHLRNGASEKAEQQLLIGIERAKEASDLSRLAFGHMNLGVVLHQRGEFGRAIEYYRECKSLFRRLGNRTQLARVLHNLGNLYLLCGDFARARAHNDEALRLAKLSGVERVVAIATGLEGLILSNLGEHEPAEEKLREAMLLQRKLGVERPLEAMVELAEFQLRFEEYERARATLSEVEQQLATVDSGLLQARASFLKGRLSLQDDPNAALELLAQARKQFETLGRRLFVRDAEISIARCLHRSGQTETARLHLAAAEEIHSSVAEELPEDLRARFDASNKDLGLVKDELEGRSEKVEPAVQVVESAPAPVEVQSAPAPRPRPTVRKPEWNQKYASIVGTSPKLNRVFHIIDRVAPSESTVLIHGESGTGKELVAEAIHKSSPRSSGPFVKLNCAALVESLLLSELFGHERGSFTGAHQRKIGRFEMAAGGTLFLDEIGDISPKTQVSLLRVLQEREFERVGGGKPIKVQARIIVATNKNLAQMVQEGTFREDLYYRLKGLTVDLPPLRDRPEDTMELAAHFLAQYAAESGTVEKTLSPSSVSLLTSYRWPGNIRELENIIRSVALFSETPIIDARDFDEYRELFKDGPELRSVPTPAAVIPEIPQVTPAPSEDTPKVPLKEVEPVADQEQDEAATRRAIDGGLLSQIFEQGIPLPELKKRIQSQAIARALRMTKGNITKAAEVLGMRRPRLSQIINASDELKALCQGVSR